MYKPYLKRKEHEGMYQSWYNSESENQIVEFENIGAMIEFSKTCDGKEEDRGNWRFGELEDLESTDKAFSEGRPLDRWIGVYEEKLRDLPDNHPELYQLEMHATKSVKRRKFAEHGGELDIDRFMCGDPEMWIQHTRKPCKNGVRVFLNISASCGNDPEAFAENMAMFVAMVDIFERSGVPCEVLIGSVSKRTTNETRLSYIYFTAKKSGEYLDQSKLLSYGAVGLFRYHVFNVFRNALKGRAREGLGGPDYARHEEDMEEMGVDVLVGGHNYEEQASYFIGQVSKLIGYEATI